MGKTPVMQMLQLRVEAAKKTYPGWRLGQVWFNVVDGMYPEITHRAQAAGIDPVQDDAFIPPFIEFVEGSFVP